MKSTGSKKRRALWALLPAAVAVLAINIAVALGAGVEPASYSATIESGGSVTIKKTGHTPAIPPNPDIVFLSDTTGSMTGPITNVRTNATSIMNAVNSAQPPGATAQFAAAEYKDGRPGPEPEGCNTDPFAFNLDEGLTESLLAVQGAINGWTANGGCDYEESQINALYELATGAVSFRPGSTRIIVWFGDAPGHDPDFGLTLNNAIKALVAANIRVIAVPVGSGLDETGQATAIATATGGEVMPSATPEEVSTKILEGLENLPVTVTPKPSCDPGLSATYDAPSKTVTSGSDATFEETLAVASNAPDGGVLNCEVDFLLNGTNASGFQQSAEIKVPLRATDLSLEKSVSPTLVTEGNNVTYTVTVTNKGADPDTNVSVSDPLVAGESFVSGDAGCGVTSGVVNCGFGTVAAGATASKSFVVTVPLGAPSSIVNTATVSGDRPESNPTDNSASATLAVNHNPVCTELVASPAQLWPPNHKLHLVTVSGATDPDGNALTTTITGVTQDEPLNGRGDGNTPRDAFAGPMADQARIRAERSGTGDGRVYALHVTVTDGLGGQCTGTATVTVPHDQRGKAAVDSGQSYTDF